MQLIGVDALSERGQLHKALDRLETIVRLAPHHTAWIERYVRLLVETGQRTKARQLVALNRARLTEEVIGRLSRLVDFTQQSPRLGPTQQALATTECGSHDAIVKYHHARLKLASSGKATRWVRRVIKICSDVGAEGFSRIRVTHIPDSQTLAVLKATRTRENNELTGQLSARALSDPVNRLYYDLQETTIHFDDLVKGDILEVVWRIRDTQPHAAMPGHYGEVAFLQESVPRQHTVLEFASDSDRPLYTGLSRKGVALKVQPGRIEGFNVPASPAADNGPGLTDLYAYAHLSTQENWSEVDGLYQALLGQRASVTPQIQSAALAAIAGVTNQRDIIGKLYRLVADRIRYVGLEYGIHSFQPAHASETWSLGYGDCKDKAVLLIAMLRAVGISSQFVLVRTRSAGTIEPKPASLSAFDHAIVYLPGLNAFIDPTVSDFDPFVLPTEDQGAQVLVVGSGELKQVPVTAAALNREQWTATFEKKNGTLTGTVDVQTIGQEATHLRRQLSDPNQRARRAKNWLNELIPQAQFSHIKYSGVTPTQDPVTLAAHVSAPLMMNSRHQMGLRLGLSDWRLVESLAPNGRRTQPLVLPQRSQRLVKTTLKGIRIENGSSLRRTIESRFGALQVDYQERADGADLSIKFTLKKRTITASAYPEFRRWLAAVDSMLSRPLRMTENES